MFNHISTIKKSQSGIAAILTVIIIGAASLIVAKSAMVIGLGELDMAWAAEKSGQTLVITEGCAEETLRRFRLDPNYSASDFSLSLGGGTCAINTSSAGDDKVIEVGGNIGDYYKSILVEITISSSTISINRWEEVSG